MGKGPLPPGGSNPITYPSGEVDLHQRFKVIYYNRDNNMYYWDPYCIDLITGPFLVDLLRANTEGLDKGYTQLLAGYDEVSYEVIAVNKKPAKPKLITIYRYHGRYYWDSECQLPYSDEFGVLSMAGVDRSIIDLELVGEKNIRPSLNEVVKPRRIRFLPAALIDTKREYIGRVYFNKDNGLFYWDDDCIDLVTGPLLVELINNKVKDVVSAHGKTMLRVGGISYSVESVRGKDYKINNVYLYEKNNSYYWDPDCTLLVEKGLNEFKSYDVLVHEAKPTRKIDPTLEVEIFYNDYDKRMYQDRECTVYMGKIDDIGILDPASKRIRGYDGKTYRLRKTYVNTDTYSEKTGFHK